QNTFPESSKGRILYRGRERGRRLPREEAPDTHLLSEGRHLTSLRRVRAQSPLIHSWFQPLGEQERQGEAERLAGWPSGGRKGRIRREFRLPYPRAIHME